MTAIVDFELLGRLARQRRFEARTLEIAKRLMIDGETPKRLALEYGINLQRVYAIRKEIVAAAQASALPPGWEEVTLAGPVIVIESLKAQLAQALAEQEMEEDLEPSR